MNWTGDLEVPFFSPSPEHALQSNGLHSLMMWPPLQTETQTWRIKLVSGIDPKRYVASRVLCCRRPSVCSTARKDTKRSKWGPSGLRRQQLWELPSSKTVTLTNGKTMVSFVNRGDLCRNGGGSCRWKDGQTSVTGLTTIFVLFLTVPFSFHIFPVP